MEVCDFICDGNLLSTTDPEDDTTWTDYDALNRAVKAVSAQSSGPNDTHYATTTTYDAAGNVTSRMAPGVLVHRPFTTGMRGDVTQRNDDTQRGRRGQEEGFVGRCAGGDAVSSATTYNEDRLSQEIGARNERG